MYQGEGNSMKNMTEKEFATEFCEAEKIEYTVLDGVNVILIGGTDQQRERVAEVVAFAADVLSCPGSSVSHINVVEELRSEAAALVEEAKLMTRQARKLRRELRSI